MPDEDRELVNAADYVRKLQVLTFHNERQDERIAEIIKEALAIEGRVRALEAYAQSSAVMEARAEERDKGLLDRLSRMEEHIKDTKDDIKGIRGLGMKALGVVGSAVVLAVVAFVLKGGLA